MLANLCIESLGKKYDKRWVIRQLDFELKSGDSLVVTGRNGSGKSTLVKLIASLLSPTEGIVSLNINSNSTIGDERRHWIGLSALDLALYLTLTGKEHLHFFSEVRGLSLNQTQIEETLVRFDLKGRGDDLVGAYSTGMKQRLRLAIATMHSPALLLLDEPGSGLDEVGRKVLDEVIAQQRERGILIVATNDIDEHQYGELALELGA
ncbi:MAG: ABC transporter ATP-binding protein [bacterium]|jgi:heme exporter protein A